MAQWASGEGSADRLHGDSTSRRIERISDMGRWGWGGDSEPCRLHADSICRHAWRMSGMGHLVLGGGSVERLHVDDTSRPSSARSSDTAHSASGGDNSPDYRRRCRSHLPPVDARLAQGPSSMGTPQRRPPPCLKQARTEPPRRISLVQGPSGVGWLHCWRVMAPHFFWRPRGSRRRERVNTSGQRFPGGRAPPVPPRAWPPAKAWPRRRREARRRRRTLRGSQGSRVQRMAFFLVREEKGSLMRSNA